MLVVLAVSAYTLAPADKVSTVVRQGDSVSVNTIWPNLPPSALHKQGWTRTPHVDKYLDMKWQPASNLLLDLGVMGSGEGREER